MSTMDIATDTLSHNRVLINTNTDADTLSGHANTASAPAPRYPSPDPEPIPNPTPPPHPHPASDQSTTASITTTDFSQSASDLDPDANLITRGTADTEPATQQASLDSEVGTSFPIDTLTTTAEAVEEDPLRPHTGRYEPTHPAYRLSRTQLRRIAATTLRRLDSGYYVPPSPPSVSCAITTSTGADAAPTSEGTGDLISRGINDGVEKAENGDASGVEGKERVEGEAENESKPELVLERYNLASRIEWTNAHTEYWAPDAPELGGPWDVDEWSGADSDVDVDMELEALSQSQTQSTNEDESEWVHKLAMEVDKDKETNSNSNSNSNSERITRIVIKEYSTLVGARRLHAHLHAHFPASGNTTIGVLNFASAKKPGGGFINGAQAQEESIARTSTLYPSLISAPAAPFYAHYTQKPHNPLYTHAMVYSPRVVLFRNDRGAWMRPIVVDVLTCAAVNAGEVRRAEERAWERRAWEEEMGRLRVRVRRAEEARERRRRRREEEEAEKAERAEEGGDGPGKEGDREEQTNDLELEGGAEADTHTPPERESTPTPASTTTPLPSSKAATVASTPHTTEELQSSTTIAPPSTPPAPPLRTPLEIERLIASVMYARIARVLALFAHARTAHLVLGSFGTGVFQNRIPLVARIFRELLVGDGARFSGVFESVVFSILGKGTVRVFRQVFGDADEGEEGGEEEEEEGREEDLDLDDNDIDVGGGGASAVAGAGAPNDSDNNALAETQMDAGTTKDSVNGQLLQSAGDVEILDAGLPSALLSEHTQAT